MPNNDVCKHVKCLRISSITYRKTGLDQTFFCPFINKIFDRDMCNDFKTLLKQHLI